jgi:hypothetical protein
MLRISFILEPIPGSYSNSILTPSSAVELLSRRQSSSARPGSSTVQITWCPSCRIDKSTSAVGCSLLCESAPDAFASMKTTQSKIQLVLSAQCLLSRELHGGQHFANFVAQRIGRERLLQKRDPGFQNSMLCNGIVNVARNKQYLH